MRAKECVIHCDECNKGALLLTTLKNKQGLPALFWLTEDEKILFQGICSNCGNEIMWSYPLMELLFSCPKDRPLN